MFGAHAGELAWWTRSAFLSCFSGGSEGKESSAMQDSQVPFLGQEDPLEREMATHPSILAWTIPWTKEPGGLQSMGSQ